MRDVLRRHLNYYNVVVPLPCFLLRQTNPGYLVRGMQEVRIIGPIKFIWLTHNVTSSGRTSLTSFNHLHWRADQVTYSIDIGHARANVFINNNLSLLPYSYTKNFSFI